MGTYLLVGAVGLLLAFLMLVLGIYAVGARRGFRQVRQTPPPAPKPQVSPLLQAYAQGRQAEPQQAAANAVLQIVKNALTP